MEIKKCPACAQLIHFKGGVKVETCWNCGRAATLAQIKSFEQKCAARAVGFFDGVSEYKFGLPIYNRRSRLELFVALPVVVLMLLICNSLNVYIVHDQAAAFSRWQFSSVSSGIWDCEIGQ